MNQISQGSRPVLGCVAVCGAFVLLLLGWLRSKEQLRKSGEEAEGNAHGIESEQSLPSFSQMANWGFGGIWGFVGLGVYNVMVSRASEEVVEQHETGRGDFHSDYR